MTNIELPAPRTPCQVKSRVVCPTVPAIRKEQSQETKQDPTKWEEAALAYIGTAGDQLGINDGPTEPCMANVGFVTMGATA